MLGRMTEVAVECVKHPQRMSVWSPQLGSYVCPNGHVEQVAPAPPAPTNAAVGAAKPPINAQFKLVFLTAAGGTLLFTFICVFLAVLGGKEPPPLFEKVIFSLFDLAKIGFGAVVGMLGAHALQSGGGS